MVIPLLTYCNIINLSTNPTNLIKLQQLSRRASAIIKRNSNSSFKLPSIQDIWRKRCCVVVSSILKNEYDENFDGFFTLMENNTRNKGIYLRLPKVKLEIGRKGFRFMGAKIFNDLPHDTRCKYINNNFNDILDTHFSLYFTN